MMELLKLRPAKEICTAVERINSALDSIKSDLELMRNQDAKLMRQMIHIYETIKKLSNSMPNYASNNGCNNSWLAVPDAQIIRRQSEPNCFTSLAISSLENDPDSAIYTCSAEIELNPSEVDSDDNNDEIFKDENHLMVPGLIRPRSLTNMPSADDREYPNDGGYEDILKTNVKLWKNTQIDFDEEVFEEENFCNSSGISIVIDNFG